MNVHEIISEAISVSNETWKVRNIITAHIKKVIRQLGLEVVDNIRVGIIADQAALIKYVNSFLHRNIDYSYDLEQQYKKDDVKAVYVMDISNKKKEGKEPDGYMSNFKIYISDKFDNQIIKAITEDFSYPVLDYDSIKQFVDNYKLSYRVESIIAKISNVFVHELVHVKQLVPQQHRILQDIKPEYRSYLEKDNEKFREMIKNIVTDYEYEIYQASPQEITAFAHMAANDMIDIITYDRDINTADYDELQHIKVRMEEFFQHKVWRSNEYRSFNQPQNFKKYQIYKRFMKIVYQELMRFNEHFEERLAQVENDDHH